jgi:hypothetical protein
MEARRQAVLQKKVEEEKIKADEEEKKAKDSADRRKKEREENTGKRPLVKADSKVGSNPALLQCIKRPLIIAS